MRIFLLLVSCVGLLYSQIIPHATQHKSTGFDDLFAPPVGIGTASPVTELHVSDTGAVQFRVESTDGGAVQFHLKSDSDTERRITARDGSSAVETQISLDNDAILFAGASLSTNLFLILNATGVGIGTSTPDEQLHVAKDIDGVAVLVLLENSQAHAASSLNETAELHFGFGGDNDVASIRVGKLDDYDPGPAENDSFMALYTDFDGTPRRRLFLDTSGMRLDQVPNFTLDLDLVAGDDVDDLIRIRLLNASRDVGWNIVFDQTFAAKEFKIQDESGVDYFTISQNFGTHAFLQPIANQTHTIFFGAGDNVDDDVRVLWQNINASSGYALLWDQSTDDFIIEDHAGIDHITIPSDGGFQLHDIGAKPTCNAAHRGTTYYDAGAAGVADTFEVCLKNAADAYNWRAAATP